MTLPLRSITPPEWGHAVLAEPIKLLKDHAYLEKKAATNALDLLARWPGEWVTGWVEAMTSIARDEAAHLAQVTRLILRRGARLERSHKNPYANELRALVRKGKAEEIVDLLLVSALIEARSCERFSVLAATAEDDELASFYKALHSSELGHYQIFLKLAGKIGVIETRWNELLDGRSRYSRFPGARPANAFGHSLNSVLNLLHQSVKGDRYGKRYR